MFSRAKSVSSQARLGGTAGPGAEKKDEVPDLETLLKRRDYLGACTLLEFMLQSGEGTNLTLPWLGYAAFHLGDFKKAIQTYETILKDRSADPIYNLYLACCYYYSGEYEKAIEKARLGPANRLQNRILMHCAHKLGDENAVTGHLNRLSESDVQDVLSGAALQYMRCQFQAAMDDYNASFRAHPDFDALNVYIALCCYKLDHFQYSLDFLDKYLARVPDSTVALNLKSCNDYRRGGGALAEAGYKDLALKSKSVTHDFDANTIKHNLVVFRNGEDAMTVLPPLVDIIPEARFNLAVYHLRQGENEQALKLIMDEEPVTPQDYIIRGVVYAALGADDDQSKWAQEAKKYLHSIGDAESERNTVPGRKCMAQYFYLERDWSQVLIYLNSIEAYCTGDPAFNYNYGMAAANLRQWRTARARLVTVRPELQDDNYLAWMLRVFIMTGDPKKAWELYTNMENISPELLQLIGDDCYRTGQFYFAFLAYDTLFRLDPVPALWVAKRGAACGVLQRTAAGIEPKENLCKVIELMRQHPVQDPEAEHITSVMINWATSVGINIG